MANHDKKKKLKKCESCNGTGRNHREEHLNQKLGNPPERINCRACDGTRRIK